MPILYKYAIGLLSLVLLIGGAYFSGYHAEYKKFEEYKIQVKQISKDQEVLAKQKDAEYVQQAQIIANSYNDYYKQLYSRLQHRPGSGSSVPKASDSAKGSDGAEQELGGTCKGSEFYNNALEDVLKLQLWQEWAKRLQLPIGE